MMDWGWGLLFYWGVVPAVLWTLFVVAAKKALAAHWGEARVNDVDMRGQVAVVTGAGSGIGFETAIIFANRGATVVVTGRTFKAAKKTVIQIRHHTFLGTLVPLRLELASLESVTKFCDTVLNRFDSLDILVNNAGVLIPVNKREKSVDGYEIHFAVNHLGHFLLTNLLLPLLKKKPSRIVAVTSLNHRGGFINFEDLMYEKTEIKDLSMIGNPLYKQSKLANILFVKELRRLLRNAGHSNVKVVACCPGIVKTKISRHFDLPWFADVVEPCAGFLFKTPFQGSQTVVHCALSKDIDEDSCILHRNCTPWNREDRTLPDDYFCSTKLTNYFEEDARKLWIESEKLVGKSFNHVSTDQ